MCAGAGNVSRSLLLKHILLSSCFPSSLYPRGEEEALSCLLSLSVFSSTRGSLRTLNQREKALQERIRLAPRYRRMLALADVSQRNYSRPHTFSSPRPPRAIVALAMCIFALDEGISFLWRFYVSRVSYFIKFHISLYYNGKLIEKKVYDNCCIHACI